MSLMEHVPQAAARRCPPWCTGGHVDAVHRSHPLPPLPDLVARVRLCRQHDPAAVPTAISLSGVRELLLTPAQARSLAACLREYAELAEYGERQWWHVQGTDDGSERTTP